MHGTHASSAPTAPNVPPARSPSTVGPLGPEIYRLPPPRSWAQPPDYHLLPVSHSHPLKEPAQKSLGTSGSQPSPMPSISAPFRLASPQARFPRPLTSTRLSQPPWPPVDYRPLSSPISTNPGPTPPPASCFCLPAAESRWGRRLQREFTKHCGGPPHPPPRRGWLAFGCCGFPVSPAPEQLFQTFPSPPAPRGFAPSLSDDLTSYMTQELEAGHPKLPHHKSLLAATLSKVSGLEMPRGWSWHQQCAQLSGTLSPLFHGLLPPGSHTHLSLPPLTSTLYTHTHTHARTRLPSVLPCQPLRTGYLGNSQFLTTHSLLPYPSKGHSF